MSRRYDLLLLTALPIAVVTVGVTRVFGWNDSGFALGVIAITLALVAIWIVDPPEFGWGRRDRKQRKAG